MSTQTPPDAKALAASNEVFGQLDKEVQDFYKIIEDKKIQINSLADVERVERYFKPHIKRLHALIDKANFPPFIKKNIQGRIVIEVFVRFSEKYNLDVFSVIPELEKSLQEMFKEALTDSKIPH